MPWQQMEKLTVKISYSQKKKKQTKNKGLETEQ